MSESGFELSVFSQSTAELVLEVTCDISEDYEEDGKKKILICFLSGRFVRFNRQHSLGSRAVSKLFNEKERRV